MGQLHSHVHAFVLLCINKRCTEIYLPHLNITWTLCVLIPPLIQQAQVTYCLSASLTRQQIKYRSSITSLILQWKTALMVSTVIEVPCVSGLEPEAVPFFWDLQPSWINKTLKASLTLSGISDLWVLILWFEFCFVFHCITQPDSENRPPTDKLCRVCLHQGEVLLARASSNSEHLHLMPVSVWMDYGCA